MAAIPPVEAVRRLRVGLGVKRLISEGETVRLNDAALEVDACEVERRRQADKPRAQLAP